VREGIVVDEVIKQPNRWSCMGCVAAMIAQETLEDFITFVGHDGSHYEATSTHPLKYNGFTLLEVMKFLLSRSYSLGSYLIALDGGVLEVNGDMAYTQPLGVPAMIGVRSQVFPPPVTHVVYWNGRLVCDPNPDVHGFRGLHDYEIIEWWPVLKHTEYLYEQGR